MGRLEVLVIVGLCLVVDTCFGLTCYECDDVTSKCKKPEKTSNSTCNGKEKLCFIKKLIHLPDGNEYLSMGCTKDEKLCDDTTSGITECSVCEGDFCNDDFSKDTVSKTVCVSCDGDGCDTSELTTNTKFCTLDKTNTKCVAYQYINITQNKAIMYKGCGVEKTCEAKTQTDTKVLCKECTDQICNQKLEGNPSTLCIDCDGCHDAEVKLNSNTTFCKLQDDDSTTNACYVYKDKHTTKRGCGETSICSKQRVDDDTLLLCNQCQGNFCNAKLDTDKAHRKCVKCSGASGSECAASIVNTTAISETCSLDDTVEITCQSTVYFNELQGTVWTTRGCSAKAKDCDILDGVLKACSVCDNADLCNKDSDLSNVKNVCIKCNSTTDDSCAILDINSKKVPGLCVLKDNDNYQCIGYQYWADDKLVTIRDCVETTKTNCTILKDNNGATSCVECKDDICNKKIEGTSTTIGPTPVTTPHPNSGSLIGGSILALLSIAFAFIRAVI